MKHLTQSILILAVLALVGTARGQYALVSSGTSAQATTLASTTISTTGSSLIVVHSNNYHTLSLSNTGYSSPVQVFDSLGNKWNRLPINISADGLASSSLFYCISPSTSSSHTFYGDRNTGYLSISVLAFSGSTSQADAYSSSFGTASTIAPGSITPSRKNALVITSVGTWQQNTSSVSGGFTILKHATAGGGSGGGIAYLVQTTKAAANPTWTLAGTASSASIIASFLPIISEANIPEAQDGTLTLPPVTRVQSGTLYGSGGTAQTGKLYIRRN